MRKKICRFCGSYFTDIDFPSQFDRMVTCGSTECAGNRRKERLRIKKNLMSSKGYMGI